MSQPWCTDSARKARWFPEQLWRRRSSGLPFEFRSASGPSPQASRPRRTAATCSSRPSCEAQQTASVSASRPSASTAPDATRGCAWNGFAPDRIVVRRWASPCQATRRPALLTTATCTLWRLSSSSPRTTVTVISAYRTGDARATGTGGLRPRSARSAACGAGGRGAGGALRHAEDGGSAAGGGGPPAVWRRGATGQGAAVRDGGPRAGADGAPDVGRSAGGGAGASQVGGAGGAVRGRHRAGHDRGRPQATGGGMAADAGGGGRAAGAHRPGAARSGVRHGGAEGGAGAAPAPAARVSSRPAGDRRDRARVRERDPACGAAVAVRERGVADAGTAGAAARGGRGSAERRHGAAGSPVPKGAGGEGRARLPGARPAGHAMPGVRE